MVLGRNLVEHFDRSPEALVALVALWFATTETSTRYLLYLSDVVCGAGDRLEYPAGESCNSKSGPSVADNLLRVASADKLR